MIVREVECCQARSSLESRVVGDQRHNLNLYVNILDKDCVGKLQVLMACLCAITTMFSGGLRGLGKRLLAPGVQSNETLLFIPDPKVLISTPRLFISHPFRASKLQGARHSASALRSA